MARRSLSLLVVVFTYLAPTAIAMSLRIRVVSYNVLSSHLCEPTFFTTLDPEHLDPKNRLPVVLKKLEEEMDRNKNTILCLQEISYDWAGALHTFCATKGFHLVTGLYGKKFNGYMGVALAWPTDAFETINVDISRLSDTVEWPKRTEKSFIDGLVTMFQSNVEDPLRKVLGFPKEEVIDHWNLSENRFNVMVAATLKEKNTNKAFVIGTYHMPCAYYAPRVMTIHSDLAVNRIQKLAQDNGNIPSVFAGDFNIKPSEPVYKMLTTGEIDGTGEYFPTPKNGFEWKRKARNTRSAYAVDGGEPDFTNYARVKERDPFIDTLDYIFLSEEWKVDSTLKIPSRGDAGGPFPNLQYNEASDHVLIAADISL